MPAYVFFQTSIPAVGEQFIAEEQQHIRVLRLRPGDEATFIDGQGHQATAVLQAVPQSWWQVRNLEQESPPREQSLLLPWMRGSKVDWIVEKAIEIGVTHIGFFPADRSEQTPPKWERLQQLTIAAMKQCGSRYLTQLTSLSPVCEWKEFPFGAKELYFGSLNEDSLPVRSVHPLGLWAWAAGPEGGWSPAEEKRLRAIGGKPLRLHRYTLRAETAAICGLSCLAAL